MRGGWDGGVGGGVWGGRLSGGWGEEFGGELDGGTNPATVLILPEAVGLIASSCPLSGWAGGLGLWTGDTDWPCTSQSFSISNTRPFRNMMESMTGPICKYFLQI